MKVLVTETISEQGLAILRQEAEVDVRIGLAGEALRAAVRGYQVLIVRSATPVDRAVIEAADVLQIIGRCGVGVDNIDVDAATRRGVLVVNSPYGNTLAAAEHTISMMLALARNIPDAAASLRAGRWERNRFLGTEVHDKTLGVIGFGRIGTEVARRAQGLEMQVVCFDPQINLERAKNMNVEVVELDELLRRSDFISFHVPLNRHTRGLINERSIELLKPTAMLINCSRGGVIDEAALADALARGRVAGAAIDVWENEPPLDDSRSPLLDAPHVVPTPHLGASTAEAQENVAVDVARQVLAAMRGEPVFGAVNLPMLEAEEYRKLRPYLQLGEQLGRFLAQITEAERIDRVELSYLGQLRDSPTAPLTRAVLRGLLHASLGDETINYVNAQTVAQDQGIAVEETLSNEEPVYHSLVRLKLTTAQNQHTAEGTCFGQDPRILGLDGHAYNIVPQGHLLVWWNTDQPGVIGQVGTLLGNAAVNIAGMQLGRNRSGGEAVAVVEVDAPVDLELLARIGQISGMRLVRRVDFGVDENGARPVLPVPTAE